MSPTVNLIAAVGRRGQLGLGGRIPWSDPEDLRWFRQMTMGGVVVIGNRTWQGIQHAGLDGRRVWIVDRRNCDCIYPDELIRMADDTIDKTPEHRTIWVAGGEFVYRKWMPYVRRAFITLVDYDGDADTWMPPLWDVLPSGSTLTLKD